MTIAACFVTPEGVVFGADSTTTAGTPTGLHYFNHSQKLFEIGDPGTLAGVAWGMGGLGDRSYRALFALLADDLAANPPTSVAEAVQRWADQFWVAYTNSLKNFIDQCKTLNSKAAYDASANPPDPQARTEAEETTFQNLKANLVVGFCLGGYVQADRSPDAYVVIVDPLKGKPTPQRHTRYDFWGAPNMIQRLIFGCDDEIKNSILSSPHWSGTDADLNGLLAQHRLGHPIILPMRDAVDFVHSCISSTIKALKFSNLSQTCGGPIELAVITADRPFRWVRHKTWDSAIADGGEK